MAITPKDISKWTVRLIENNTIIYRPAKKADYTENGEHYHTDFFLEKHRCLQHWWYTASWLQDEKDEMLPPKEQTFGEYIQSLSREISTVDPFGSITIMEAVTNLIRLDKQRAERSFV